MPCGTPVPVRTLISTCSNSIPSCLNLPANHDEVMEKLKVAVDVTYFAYNILMYSVSYFLHTT